MTHPRDDVVAIILAAGGGRRLGNRAKALLSWSGEPLVLRMLRVFRDAGVSNLAVVTGAWADDVARALSSQALSEAGLGHQQVRVLHNPDWASGQASSVLTAALTAQERDWPRLLLSPVDLPDLSAAVVARVAGHDPERVAQPVVAGLPTHPVAIPSSAYQELTAALRTGPADRGAGPWLRTADVDRIDVSDLIQSAPADVDTPADLPEG